MKDHDRCPGYYEGDPCPVHGTPSRKLYTFGSSMSCETDVCTFRGCACAVSISHDPVGVLDSVIKYHSSYRSAAGTGRLRSEDWKAKCSW